MITKEQILRRWMGCAQAAATRSVLRSDEGDGFSRYDLGKAAQGAPFSAQITVRSLHSFRLILKTLRADREFFTQPR